MFLDVGNGHKVYYEEYGNPKGIKILFLHGGPGLGCSEKDKSFFDPERFHVVFLDQRGSGRSIPKGELSHNTTQDLLSDISKLLNHLSVDSVTIFAGSWGATLAVLFAAENPTLVNRLILRGFFAAGKECANIYLKGGIRKTHPGSWKRVSSFVPPQFQKDVAAYYFDKIKDDDLEMGQEWSRYGLSLSRKEISITEIDEIISTAKIDLDRIKIELHFALNSFFIPNNYVLDQSSKIGNIPTIIIHGEHDYICPFKFVEEFHAKLSRSELILVDAGHSASEPKIKEALLNQLSLI